MRRRKKAKGRDEVRKLTRTGVKEKCQQGEELLIGLNRLLITIQYAVVFQAPLFGSYCIVISRIVGSVLAGS